MEKLPLPTTYLLPAHIPEDIRLKLEDEIPNLTYDITEAKLVIGKVGTAKRAEFELRSRGVWTEPVNTGGVKSEIKDEIKNEGNETAKVKDEEQEEANRKHRLEQNAKRKTEPPAKKMRLGFIGKMRPAPRKEESMKNEKDEVITIDSSTEGEDSDDRRTPSPSIISQAETKVGSPTPSSVPAKNDEDTRMSTLGSDEGGRDVFIDWDDGTIKVVKLTWYEESVSKGYLLSTKDYLVFEGRPVPKPGPVPAMHPLPRRQGTPEDTMARARADPRPKAAFKPHGQSKSGHSSSTASQSQSQHAVTRPTHLLHETTSEHDNPNKLSPLPEWLHSTYSCQRSTPLHPPNEEFIKELKKIRQSRVLTNDEIGVRAYSSAIAAIAAYPYEITSYLEITRLPGTGEKIAALWQEWKEWGSMETVREIEADEDLKLLQVFYNIWGVGAKGAKDFYYKKGWRDLDDIVEYGWDTLSRVQQIGLKYYDEFLDPIPRAEVERIGSIILKAANKVMEGCQMVIVGGHRRGKEKSGDVDVVVTHPDEGPTAFMVTRIVEQLEIQGWITHTLLLSTANSERNQTPVSWKGEGGPHGTGFDTLDKALVVWQDPSWPTKEKDLAENPKAKNPNVHRRVDIILSPWRTIGCAVGGWTSGTTFQRDLRRWAKDKKNLKFDSSGIRSREDGHWVDFEGEGGKAQTILEAEKKVFRGLGLEWIEPTDRCTG